MSFFAHVVIVLLVCHVLGDAGHRVQKTRQQRRTRSHKENHNFKKARSQGSVLHPSKSIAGFLLAFNPIAGRHVKVFGHGQMPEIDDNVMPRPPSQISMVSEARRVREHAFDLLTEEGRDILHIQRATGKLAVLEPLREAASHADGFSAAAVVNTGEPDLSKFALESLLGLPSIEPVERREAANEAAAVLRSDIEALAAAWGELTGEPEAAVTLTLTRSTTCRKMHIDHVKARVLCTYFGRGTQWAQPGLLGKAASARMDGEGLLREALITAVGVAPVSAAEGDVLVIKGERWPGNSGRSILHRSPMVGLDEWRLFVKIDAPHDNSDLENRIACGLDDEGCELSDCLE